MSEALQEHLGRPKEEGPNYAVFDVERDLNVEIQGVSITGGPDLSVDLHFYFAADEKALLTSEWPVRQGEVKWLQKELLHIGGVVSAVHNRWLFTAPQIYYIHWQIMRKTAVLGKELAGVIKRLKARKA